MNVGAQVLALALQHLGERYVLGARACLLERDWRGPWDCAEFASWCVYRASGIVYGAEPRHDAARADAYTGFWAAHSRADGSQVSVALAARTPGALLLRAPGKGQAIGHIAISDGQGGTVEAHSTARGVCRARVGGRRWDCGVWVPGIAYEPQVAVELGEAPPVLRITTPITYSPAVADVQRALQARFFDAGPIDGRYGQRTAEAVRQFQLAAGLVADGEVGPATRAALGMK